MKSETIYKIAKLHLEEHRNQHFFSQAPEKIYFERMTAFDPSFSIYMPCRIVCAAHYEYNGEFNLHNECEDMYDLIYFYKGGAVITVMNDQKFIAKEGDILFLNTNIHYTIKNRDNLKSDVFLLRNHGFLCASYYQLMMQDGFHMLKARDPQFIDSLFNRICFYMQYPTNSNNTHVTNVMTQFYTELYLWEKGDKTDQTEYGHPVWFLDTIKYIEENFSNNITIEHLADNAGLSESHFFRLFKAYTSTSPYEYLTRVRIDKAKLLLNTTDNQIKFIAQAIGMHSVSRFIVQFKRITGVTPGQYLSRDK
ncbi:MAG: helix-turn-helix domain-containing protein [Eubacteriales bacterium]